ncbi:NUDIX domain-containing protein [Streptomyces sp. DSM 40750]|uniref:NUDIX domain-containing protein n=1 Tax=Streptomyces sp. DSM 40750 TaxID=2801030 RepID=UPI0027D4536A|nr:NUDIX hydrolase [Streptomyces sp. DSM 40750]
MAEANEPPEQTVVRGLREELGLDVTVRGLLVVDWVPPHGPWDDHVALISDGGVLDIEPPRPHDEELSETRFVSLDEAGGLLRDRMRRRLTEAVHALREKRPVYLHDGRQLRTAS